MRGDSLVLLAQNNFSQNGGGGSSAVVLLIDLVIIVGTVAGLWKIFAKAGKPGWAALIPIYNAVVMLEIIGKPIWWIILLLIPCVNIIIGILLAVELAKCFGKGGGFAAGMIFLPFIFYPILGFGDARYRGPAPG
ncbi:MAG TPA: DUF5684 domain-containing protein [Pirellulales bacterium]|nr:DUF5684 domain-containing protein [Pirellulales bacterium]